MRKNLTEEEKEIRLKKYRETQKKRYLENKDDINKRRREYREANKDKISQHNKNYSKKHKEKLKEKRDNNKDWMREYNKKYYMDNVEREKKRSYDYKKAKRKYDKLYSFKDLLRVYINRGLLRKNHNKKWCKTENILGCSFNEFKSYLESKFESWMTWENRGLYNGELNYGWDIDHIIPLSSGKTIEDVIKLNHHTNLRPLCSRINRDKR